VLIFTRGIHEHEGPVHVGEDELSRRFQATRSTCDSAAKFDDDIHPEASSRTSQRRRYRHEQNENAGLRETLSRLRSLPA